MSEQSASVLAVYNGGGGGRKTFFLDVLVRKEEKGFSTAIYRKPTFTRLYTRWDSYCSTNEKISLIRALIHRAKKICSPQHLKAETEKLLVLFEKNG